MDKFQSGLRWATSLFITGEKASIKVFTRKRKKQMPHALPM